MKQPSFNLEADDNYSELKNFSLEVNTIVTSYNTHHVGQLAIVKYWFGRNGLQLTHGEKEKYNTIEGLFKTLTNKFRPQFNKMIKSL